MRWQAPLATAAALAAVVLLRVRHTRRLLERSRGEGPGVRTDDGVLLHVETDDHAGSAVTVVLCHGFAAREEVFRQQREALQERARVVLFDQRGHHESGWAGHRSLTMDRLARDLATVVAAAGPGPVVLVGHSLGALTVLALADRRPDLFGTTVVGVGLLSGSSGRLLRSVLPRRLADALVASGAVSGLTWSMWLLAPVVDLLRPVQHRWGRQVLRERMYGTDPVPPRSRESVRRMWLGTSQSKAAALLPALLQFDCDDALPVLGRVPALVLAGAEDATIPAAHSRRMAEGIGASARCRVVEGAGHMVPLTHPATVNEELLALLERVATAAEAGAA